MSKYVLMQVMIYVYYDITIKFLPTFIYIDIYTFVIFTHSLGGFINDTKVNSIGDPSSLGPLLLTKS